MPWPKQALHSQLGLSDKGCANEGLVVCNSWDVNELF